MKKLRKKIVKILFVILTVLLIVCSLRRENTTYNINTQNVINYKYVLVNKGNKLNNNFIPENLVKVKRCSLGNFYLEEEAAYAYESMCVDLINKGLNISITSAYRSYDEQKELYNTYLKLYGKSYVDKYVAIPGCSEHQTGLAVDLESLEYDIFKNSQEYLWVKENSYKYGFIIRYQKGREKITGYSAEEWHIRYVGKKTAEYIYKNNITFEEYYDLFLK